MSEQHPFVKAGRELSKEELSELNNEELVIRMSTNPHEYYFLPASTKKSKKVALAALKASLDFNIKGEVSLSVVPSSLRGDKAFIMEYLDTCRVPIISEELGDVRFISEDLLKDKGVVLKIISDYPYFIKELSHELRDDEDIVRMAAFTYSDLLRYASDRLKLDRNLQAEMLAYKEISPREIPEEIRDETLVRMAFTLEPKSIFNLQKSAGNINDKTLFTIVLKNHQKEKSFFIERLQKSDKDIKTAEDSIFHKKQSIKDRFNDTLDSSIVRSQNFIVDLVPYLEYLTDQLSLDDLKTVDCSSDVFANIVSKRELLALEQDKASIKKDKKASRRIGM